MFDFSFSELLLVMVVGLVVLGPDELPKVVRYVRNIIRQVKSASANIQQQVTELLDDEDLQRATKFIKGDDGKFYAAYDLSDEIKSVVNKPDIK
jgi:sec-independent protein translocase protein TatB